MADFGFVSSREEAFDFLDSYAHDQRTAIRNFQLGKDTGIIKSYMLETSLDHQHDPLQIFANDSWQLAPLDDSFFRASYLGEDYGFLELASSRHMLFHTVRNSRSADPAITRNVKTSADLDFVWLSGYYLNIIWEAVIKEQMPSRFVKFKFEFEDIFRYDTWEEEEIPLEENEEDELPINEQDESEEDGLHRTSRLTIGMAVSKIAAVLPQLQSTLPDFKVMRMLRIPASDKIRGGYEFWDWGKITYRSPSFRDGRSQLYSILEVYQKVTELIEDRVWFQAQNEKLENGIDSIRLTGAPISFLFRIPLELTTFHNFISTVFDSDKGQKDFRLWGNPIYFSEKNVQVYGLDMHLWQKIYIEFTPSRFIVILPQHTCGNTVHRLIRNIQSYLAPDVEVYIGDRRYEEIILDVLLGRGELP